MMTRECSDREAQPARRSATTGGRRRGTAWGMGDRRECVISRRHGSVIVQSSAGEHTGEAFFKQLAGLVRLPVHQMHRAGETVGFAGPRQRGAIGALVATAGLLRKSPAISWARSSSSIFRRRAGSFSQACARYTARSDAGRARAAVNRVSWRSGRVFTRKGAGDPSRGGSERRPPAVAQFAASAGFGRSFTTTPTRAGDRRHRR